MPSPKYRYKAKPIHRFLGTTQNHMGAVLDLYWKVNTGSFFFIGRHSARYEQLWSIEDASSYGLYSELWKYAEPLVREAMARKRDPSISPNA